MQNRHFTRLLIGLIVLVILAVGAYFTVQYLQSSKEGSDIKTTNQQVASENILIVYLSRTGNTEAVARMIQNEVGGTIAELEPETPYPENYQAQVDQVSDENARGYLPPLKTRIENIDQYDTIFLGAPTWGMQLLPPMISFLNEYDLDGKTVIPFNTNGGYGIGSSFDDIKEGCEGCDVLEGFSVEGGRERDGILYVMEGNKEIEVRRQVTDWLERIGI